MAHPFHKHNEESAGKARAGHLTKEYKRGGKVKHGDEAEDRKLFGKMLKEHDKGEHKVHGKAAGGRLDKYARGGRTKGHHTKININIAPRGPHPADGAAPPALGSPPMGGGPALPPPGPGGPPPMGGPPMGGPPPGGLPPGLGPKPPGMMKRGGVVKKAEGGEVKAETPNLPLRYPSRYGRSPASQHGMDTWVSMGGKQKDYKHGGRSVKRAHGGKVPMKAGAETGPGRLEKAKEYKARG